MHLLKILFIFTILFSSCLGTNGLPKGYDSMPVLLHLSDAKQHDSIGFNLVRSIPELLYPKLLTGDLALWENASKKSVVGGVKLAALEKLATRPFVRSEDVFIHEYWRIFKKNFTFELQGFTFSGTNKAGGKINYGFVDAQDIIDLLKTESIYTNASGTSKLSYWDALQSKTYNFNLVQFGQDDFKRNAQFSAMLQYQAIHDPKILREIIELENTKTMRYKVLSPSINSNKENKNVYRVLEDYINKNKQIVLNAAKTGHFSKIMFEKWKVDNITISEKWSKYKSIAFQELLEMEFFIDKHSVRITKKQLEEMGVKINMQGLDEYLSEKRFSFLLEQINDQEILPQQSEQYYEALLNNKWNNISL